MSLFVAVLIAVVVFFLILLPSSSIRRWLPSLRREAVGTDRPGSLASRPLGRVTLALCYGALLLASLFIIVAVCFRLLDDFPQPVIETILLAVIVVWASIPLSASRRDLLANAAYYATMLFPILYFIVYQNLLWFWLTLAVLVSIVLVENRKRLDNEPVYTKIAQTIIVITVIANGLYRFSERFLPGLQATLVSQFSYIYEFFKLREAVVLIVLFIILYGTAVNTIHRFQLSDFFDFGPSPVPHPNPLVSLFRAVVYYTRNFFRIVAKAFLTVIQETILYIWTTFLSAHLWWTILYIAGTAALMSLLVADVIYIQPQLVQVLRNTEPFLAPSTALLVSYAYLVVGFFVATVALFLLTRIWLPRAAERESLDLAFRKLILGSAGIVICFWVAAFSSWLTNLIFRIDDKQFVTAGYFTASAIVFVIWASVLLIRSGRLRPTEQPPPIQPSAT